MAQRNFLGQLKELQDKLEKLQPEILQDVADYIVTASPDDTGAYVLSHSIGQSGNVGYSLSSKDRTSNPNTHRQEALEKLQSQIQTIPPTQTKVWIGNNAPHAGAVETGGHNWKSNGYYVYSTLRNIFPSIIQSAKSRVGLR